MPIIIRQMESKEGERKAISMDQGMPKLPLQVYKDMNTNGKISQIINSNYLELQYKVSFLSAGLSVLGLSVALLYLSTIFGIFVNFRGHKPLAF